MSLIKILHYAWIELDLVGVKVFARLRPLFQVLGRHNAVQCDSRLVQYPLQVFLKFVGRRVQILKLSMSFN